MASCVKNLFEFLSEEHFKSFPSRPEQGGFSDLKTLFDALNVDVEVPKLKFEVRKYKAELPKHKIEDRKYKVELPKYKIGDRKYKAELPKYKIGVPNSGGDVFSIDPDAFSVENRLSKICV